MNHYLNNEQELIQKCIARDAAAQKQLYMLYGAKMYGVCLRYMGNEEDAKDLLQEGFIKLFDKLHMYKDGNLAGWMSRIFTNMAITTLRNKQRGPLLEDIETKEVEQSEDEPEVDGQISVADVMTAMKQLPDKYRTILNLYAVDNLNHKEISNMLGVSEGTSKSQLSRARVMLKELLEKK